jgi:hypothetical protein
MTQEAEKCSVDAGMVLPSEKPLSEWRRKRYEWTDMQEEDPWVLSFWRREGLDRGGLVRDKYCRMCVKFNNPLMYALMKQDHAALENVLLRGADPNEEVDLDDCPYALPYVPLAVAASLNDRRAAEILLAHGADPNKCVYDVNQWDMSSVLTRAVSWEAYGVADVLLNAGAMVSKSGSWHTKCCAHSPIYFAVQNGDLRTLARLLEHLDTHRDDTFWIAEYYSDDWSDAFVECLLSDDPAHAQALRMLLENPQGNHELTEWRHSDGYGLRGILESMGWSVLLRVVEDFNTLLLEPDSDKAMMLHLRKCFPVVC